ncbi:TPA: hypothetical protein ENS27_07185 [bacterium]|nr:hypothetical protein [bacterium]
MELDEFLEKDIIHFLEEKKEKKSGGPTLDREEDYGLYLTKDYIKEVTRALEKDEITEAQRLFNELKAHYDTLPKSGLEAKKIYSILEQLYSKINAYNQLKGNVQVIKTFDDALGRGFQGSIPQKIHQTTTKIDKKIDNIDLKLTAFGKDVKDLKNTLLENGTSSIVISKNDLIKPSTPKIIILPPDMPKYESKNKTKIVEEYFTKKPDNEPSEKKSLEKRKEIDQGKEADQKQMIKEETGEKQKIIEKTSSSVSSSEETISSSYNDKNVHLKMYSFDKNSSIAKTKDNKIRLYKVPKIIDRKKHGRKIMEKIPSVPEKLERDNIQVSNKEGISKTKDQKIPELKITKKITENAIDKNMLFGRITLPESPEKKLYEKKDNEPEYSSETFDSPFQIIKPQLVENKNLVLGGLDKKRISDNKKSTERINDTNEYSELYLDALREMNLMNYEGASKLFMRVLELKPNHKASIIRLKQCEEAMHNA